VHHASMAVLLFSLSKIYFSNRILLLEHIGFQSGEPFDQTLTGQTKVDHQCFVATHNLKTQLRGGKPSKSVFVITLLS